jgi:hypothetical protein
MTEVGRHERRGRHEATLAECCGGSMSCRLNQIDRMDRAGLVDSLIEAEEGLAMANAYLDELRGDEADDAIIAPMTVPAPAWPVGGWWRPVSGAGVRVGSIRPFPGYLDHHHKSKREWTNPRHSPMRWSW